MTQFSVMPKVMHCSFCHSDGHWMKDREVIICPKLKAKKQKEKKKRDEEKRARAIKNFNSTTTVKPAPIKTESAFSGARFLLDQEERIEAATLIQKNVRRCIAEHKCRRLRVEIEEIKARKKANKGKKGKKKNRILSEKVYFEEPTR